MINESRYLEIARTMLTLADAHKLAEIVYAEYQRHLELDPEAHFAVSASCEDGMSFRGADLRLFEDNSPLCDHPVSSLEITADGFAPVHWRIDVEMVPGDSPHRNYIRITGTDPDWVNNVLSRFEEAIATFSPEISYASIS